MRHGDGTLNLEAQHKKSEVTAACESHRQQCALSAHCTRCPPRTYPCSFTMCSISSAQPSANQKRTKYPLSIRGISRGISIAPSTTPLAVHYITMCLPLWFRARGQWWDCSDTDGRIPPSPSDSVEPEIFQPKSLSLFSSQKLWFWGIIMSVVKVLCCLLLTHHLNEAKKIKENETGEWNSTLK